MIPNRLYSPDAEFAVIGRLMQSPSAIDSVGGLKPDHFFVEAHQHIYRCILGMSAAGKPIDVIAVAEALHAAGLEEKTGGLAYLGEIAANTPAVGNVRHYAEIITGKLLERQLLAAAELIQRTVESVGTTRDKLMAAQAAVMAITESVAPRQPRLIKDVLIETVEILERRASGQVRCLPTHFVDLDRVLCGGLRPGNVIVVAGRPAMGKTAFAVNIALNVANHSVPALILSQEMSDQEVADRLIAQAGRVALSEVLAGNMVGESGDRIMAGVGRLMDLPIIIDDQGGLTLFDVAAKARAVKRKYGLSLMVLDYLQLMISDGDSRNQQIDAISRGVKALAKELDVPVILLSQLSRNCEGRPNKRPVPSDLRDSGAIEQDADVILMVYRDEVYNADSPDRGTAEIIIGKARQGSTGTVRMAFNGEFTQFSNLAHDWRPDASAAPVKTKKRGFHD